MLGATACCWNYMRLHWNQSFNNDILYSMHHSGVTDSILVKVLLQLCQIPFTCVIFACCFCISFISSSCLDVILTFFVDGVIGKMDISFFCRFLTIRVFLCSKSCKSFLEEINLQRVKTCDKSINSKIILEAIYQVWIRDVLRDNIAWLPLDFLFAPNHFDASATRRSTRLHDVHMLVVLRFSVHCELTEVIRE